MVLQTTGPITISDIAVEFCPPAGFEFVAGINTTANVGATLTGVHTASPFATDIGSWASPLPVIPLTGATGTASSPLILPDGFEYGCGMLQHQTGILSLSLSRWNGTSYENANVSWTPFNNMVVNGPSWSNISLPFIVGGVFLEEFFVSWTGLPQTAFVGGSLYTITFN